MIREVWRTGEHERIQALEVYTRVIPLLRRSEECVEEDDTAPNDSHAAGIVVFGHLRASHLRDGALGRAELPVREAPLLQHT